MESDWENQGVRCVAVLRRGESMVTEAAERYTAMSIRNMVETFSDLDELTFSKSKKVDLRVTGVYFHYAH